jgi:acyl carrier protein
MIKEKVVAIMKSVFKMNYIPDNISQASYPEWDSLKHLQLVVALEEEFGFSFEPEEIEQMITLECIIDMLKLRS